MIRIIRAFVAKNQKDRIVGDDTVRLDLENVNRLSALLRWLNVCHCALTRFSSVQVIEMVIRDGFP